MVWLFLMASVVSWSENSCLSASNLYFVLFFLVFLAVFEHLCLMAVKEYCLLNF